MPNHSLCLLQQWLLLLLSACCLLPTLVSAQSSFIAVSGGDDFSAGATIRVEFVHPLAATDDFVAIYPASVSNDALGDEGLMWRYLCNKQGSPCPVPVTMGSLGFNSAKAVWGGDASLWPLPAGSYKAYLVQNVPAARYWPMLAESAVFTIDGGGGGSTDDDGTDDGSTDDDGTVGGGGGGSAVDHETVRQHLTEARTEIEELVRGNARLPAKFLRMMFHDCIGGCDGTCSADECSNVLLLGPYMCAALCLVCCCCCCCCAP